MIYLYLCPIHNEFEIEHPITQKLEICPLCQKDNLPEQKVVRLINSANGFILGDGGVGWAKDNYSK